MVKNENHELITPIKDDLSPELNVQIMQHPELSINDTDTTSGFHNQNLYQLHQDNNINKENIVPDYKQVGKQLRSKLDKEWAPFPMPA